MTSKAQLEITQRRKIVAANILAGLTYQEIATALNVSTSTVSRDYHAILNDWKAHYTASMDHYLYIQLQRLNVLMNAIWERARNGDPHSIDRALAILDRQNKLLKLESGIDPHTHHHAIQLVEVHHTVSDPIQLPE